MMDQLPTLKVALEWKTSMAKPLHLCARHQRGDWHLRSCGLNCLLSGEAVEKWRAISSAREGPGRAHFRKPPRPSLKGRSPQVPLMTRLEGG